MMRITWSTLQKKEKKKIQWRDAHGTALLIFQTDGWRVTVQQDFPVIVLDFYFEKKGQKDMIL